MKPYLDTPGDIVVNAVIRASALAGVELDDDGVIFIWEANAPEQIEAALAEAGWELRRIHK
jgi:septum formation inhibitor MinC